MIKANIIQHTRHMDEELITMEVEFPRFILAQINTHRTFSRNYQSSRAMPILKQMEQISKEPFMPVRYGSAQKGMVAGEELTGWRLNSAKFLIKLLSKLSLSCVYGMQKLGLSKEIANRYLEPWMLTKGVITATDSAWEAFFILRAEHDAQPEIQELAIQMRDAFYESPPFVLEAGELHVPYCEYSRENGKLFYDGSPLTGPAIKKAIVAVAQVSYRTVDTSPEKIERVWDMLKFPSKGVYKNGEGNVHFSPAECVAIATNNVHSNSAIKYSGNFNTRKYIQFRKLLELGEEGKYL